MIRKQFFFPKRKKLRRDRLNHQNNNNVIVMLQGYTTYNHNGLLQVNTNPSTVSHYQAMVTNVKKQQQWAFSKQSLGS